MKSKLKRLSLYLLIATPIAFYLGGVIGQYYKMQAGIRDSTTASDVELVMSDFEIGFGALKHTFSSKYGVTFFVISIVFLMILMVYRFGFPEQKLIDDVRKFEYAEDGAYGTARWLGLDGKKVSDILDVKPIDKTDGIILGAETSSLPVKSYNHLSEKEKTKDVYSLPKHTRLNEHVAVFGASGTMKSRAFGRNEILQHIKHGDSMVITDPKGELYEDSKVLLEKEGYTVRALNLVNLENSDSWNMLAEIGDDEVMAQIFVETIFRNTTSAKDAGSFWTMAEMNLCKALCLYVCLDPTMEKTMSSVYKLITTKTPDELDAMFKSLSITHPARGAYNVYSQSGDNVKGGVVIGLGSRLQLFQSQLVCEVTSYKEIDLLLPATEKCAYFCITSDQHSTFDFIAALFYSMLFIKLVEFADEQPNKQCPKKVYFILDEFPNIGQIPDFEKKMSTIRSRGLNVSILFQSITQLMEKYPHGKWETILNNCDTKLFLGCNEMTTAEFISEMSGEVTQRVHSENKSTTGESEGSATGKRRLILPDEVRRLPNDECLIMIRGQNMLRGFKFDFTRHPMAKGLVKSSIEDHVPEWRRRKESESQPKASSWVEREIEREKKLESPLESQEESTEIRVSKNRDFLI